jgi:hypothetical protein
VSRATLRNALTLTASAALLLACCGIALAGSSAPRRANLDSDPALERVVAQKLCQTPDGSVSAPQPACGKNQFPGRRIAVEDTCNGAPYTLAISSVQDFVDRLRVVEADGSTGRREVFFDIRSGATGRGGEARVVAFRAGGTGGCLRAVDLFRYPTRATLGRVPRGASGHDSWSPVLRQFSRRYRGLEIRLTETYVDRDDAFCCPSFLRVTYFRYDRARKRYRRYRSAVRRIKH